MRKKVAPEVVIESSAEPPYMQYGPPRYGHRKRVFFIPVHGPRPYAKVDACDFNRAIWIKWHQARTGYPAGWLRARGSRGGRLVTLHALILGRRKGYVIDHLNGDKYDCRRSNLCFRPQWQNLHNVTAYRNSTSGIRGVCAVKLGRQTMWMVRLGFDYKPIWLALCHEKEEARRIIDTGIALLYGRAIRLTNGEPFEESHIAKIVAETAGIGPRNLRRVLDRTAGHGDSLSAQLREKLLGIAEMREDGEPVSPCNPAAET